MTLATICANALAEMSSFEIPSNFFGNANLTARSCVALVRREASTLERQHRWPSLITTHTFATVNGTSAYDMPADFRAFANMSQWNRTAQSMLIGPTSGADWQWLKGSIGAGATVDQWFRIEGTRLVIHPTPTAAETIAFDYYSRYVVTKASDGTTAADWTHDSDTSRLDEELLTLGLKWRFLQAKGMPFEPEYREYEAVVEEALADAGGKGKISLSARPVEWDGIPDTGFGA